MHQIIEAPPQLLAVIGIFVSALVAQGIEQRFPKP